MTRAIERVAGIQRRVPFGVALTFDECDASTLDALASNDVRATFFLADLDVALVRHLRAAGHGIGWRTEVVHDVLTRLDGRVPRLHRPADLPSSFADAVRFRRRRLDAWLWSIDESNLDAMRERDVVRVTGDIDRAITVVRARGLEPIAL